MELHFPKTSLPVESPFSRRSEELKVSKIRKLGNTYLYEAISLNYDVLIVFEKTINNMLKTIRKLENSLQELKKGK